MTASSVYLCKWWRVRDPFIRGPVILRFSAFVSACRLLSENSVAQSRFGVLTVAITESWQSHFSSSSFLCTNDALPARERVRDWNLIPLKGDDSVRTAICSANPRLTDISTVCVCAFSEPPASDHADISPSENRARGLFGCDAASDSEL